MCDMSLVNRRGAGMSGERTVVTALEEKMSYPGIAFVIKAKTGTYGERTAVIGTEDFCLRLRHVDRGYVIKMEAGTCKEMPVVN